MAINKNNRRIAFTVSERQYNWIHLKAKEKHMQISQFLQWLINKNLDGYFAKLKQKNPQEIQDLTREESKEELQKQVNALLDDLEEPKNENTEDELPF